MSLQLAANHLAAQGRGPDSTLVHMSPGEVKSLQQLAMAHGGSLSVNPSTGLPEAGFLSSILPMVAGAALTATGIGAPMAALMVGGGMTAATGSLQKGLMAGLGAYGGAGLAGGLLGAGSAAAAGATAPGAEVLDAALAGSGGAAGAGAGLLGGSSAVDLAAGATNIAPSYGIAPPSLGPEQMMGDAAFKANMTPLTGGTGVAGGMPAQGFEGFQPTPSAQAGLMPATPMPTTPMPAQVPPTATQPGFGDRLSQMGRGVEALGTSQGRDAFMKNVGGAKGLMQSGLAAAAPIMLAQPEMQAIKGSPNPNKYRFDYNSVANPEEGYTGARTGERRYFNPVYTRMAGGGAVEQMSDANALGANTGYPMADIQRTAYATPYQQPMSRNVVTGPQDSAVDTFTGEERFAQGGVSHLGDYSDGGRLLRGPGDGVSDSIPAVIGNKRPARLADGEFVVPARIVSELGNGSTEAGARKLYAMMDRIQKARSKTTGKNRVAKNTRSEKYLPA